MDQFLQISLIIILAVVTACYIRQKSQNESAYIFVFGVFGLTLIVAGIVIVVLFEKAATLVDVLLLRVYTIKGRLIFIGYTFLLSSLFLIFFGRSRRSKRGNGSG